MGRRGRKPRVVALCAARDEAGRVGDSVRALRRLGRLDEVVVVDDGSDDGTAQEARSAGARVLRPGRNLGKGGALEGALSKVRPATVYLFVDADVGGSAGEAGPLLDAVLDGRADLAVGVLPRPPAGGFGLVKDAAAWLIERTAGGTVNEPLSGQRAVSAECLFACRPLAAGFGVEAAMTADALRLGFRILEVPVEMGHRFTGRDVAGFAHRARQGADILGAMAPRVLGLR